MKKRMIIGIGVLLAAAALLLVILNPANSPNAVFSRYLSCMRSENTDLMQDISYEANFSKNMTAENVTSAYQSRFTSADESYKTGGKVDLLKDASVRITDVTPPKQSDISSRRTTLSENYRDTMRITDIRNITFTVTRGDVKTTGTAEAICVTGKWYIADVTGI